MPTSFGWSDDDIERRAVSLAALIRRAWRKVAAALVGKKNQQLSMNDLGALPRLWAQQVDRVILGTIGSTVLDGAAQVSGMDGFPDGWELTEDLVERHLRAAQGRLWDVGADVWFAVRDQLIEGHLRDESISDIAARVRHTASISDHRALTIARTEIHAALEAGSYAQAAMVEPNGKKTWLATEDTRTRESHRHADGQVKFIGEPFIVGGSRLAYPGDPAGPPEEIINCRCSVAYDLDFADLGAPDDASVMMTAAVHVTKVREWDEAKHPRGKDGKFISKGTVAYHALTDEDDFDFLSAIGDLDQADWNNFTPKQQSDVIKRHADLSALQSPYPNIYAKAKTNLETFVQNSPADAKTEIIDTMPALAPAVPADIYKKHKDGRVAAVSANGLQRLRYDAKQNKWELQGKLSTGEWATEQTLTKKAAYDVVMGNKTGWKKPKVVKVQAGQQEQKTVPSAPPEAPKTDVPDTTTAPSTTPAPSTAPTGPTYPFIAGTKLVPATIYKPHADGEIVAVDDNGLVALRYDAKTNKYHAVTLDENGEWSTKWSGAPKTKKVAYEEAKSGEWFSPIENVSGKTIPEPAGQTDVVIPEPPTQAVKATTLPKPKNLKHIKAAGSGESKAQIYEDEDGNRWLVKSKSASGLSFESERAAAALQREMGLLGPAAYIMEVDGKTSIVQAMFDGKNAFKPHTFDPEQLSEQDIVDMQREQVLDWLIGNNDSHSGQFIRLPNGHLTSIDKGHAFRFYALDELKPQYAPWEPLHGNRITYPEMWRVYEAGGPVGMVNPATGPVREIIDNAMAIPNDELREMFRPYAEGAATQGWLGKFNNDPEKFLDAIVHRKENLLHDFTALYDTTTATRQQKLGVTPTVPKPAPTSDTDTKLPTPTGTPFADTSALVKLQVTDKHGWGMLSPEEKAELVKEWQADSSTSSSFEEIVTDWEPTYFESTGTPSGKMTESDWLKLAEAAAFLPAGAELAKSSDGQYLLQWEATYPDGPGKLSLILNSDTLGHVPMDLSVDLEEEGLKDQADALLTFTNPNNTAFWVPTYMNFDDSVDPKDIGTFDPTAYHWSSGSPNWLMTSAGLKNGAILHNIVVARTKDDNLRVRSHSTIDGKFVIEQNQGGHWQAIEIVDADEIGMAAILHADQNDWVSTFAPSDLQPVYHTPLPTAMKIPTADISTIHASTINMVHEWFINDKELIPSSPDEAIWDALQEYKKQFSGDTFTDGQLLAMLDTATGSNVQPWTQKIHMWLQTLEGKTYAQTNKYTAGSTPPPPTPSPEKVTADGLWERMTLDYSVGDTIAENDEWKFVLSWSAKNGEYLTTVDKTTGAVGAFPLTKNQVTTWLANPADYPSVQGMHYVDKPTNDVTPVSSPAFTTGYATTSTTLDIAHLLANGNTLLPADVKQALDQAGPNQVIAMNSITTSYPVATVWWRLSTAPNFGTPGHPEEFTVYWQNMDSAFPDKGWQTVYSDMASNFGMALIQKRMLDIEKVSGLSWKNTTGAKIDVSTPSSSMSVPTITAGKVYQVATWKSIDTAGWSNGDIVAVRDDGKRRIIKLNGKYQQQMYVDNQWHAVGADYSQPSDVFTHYTPHWYSVHGDGSNAIDDPTVKNVDGGVISVSTPTSLSVMTEKPGTYTNDIYASLGGNGWKKLDDELAVGQWSEGDVVATRKMDSERIIVVAVNGKMGYRHVKYDHNTQTWNPDGPDFDEIAYTDLNTTGQWYRPMMSMGKPAKTQFTNAPTGVTTYPVESWIDLGNQTWNDGDLVAISVKGNSRVVKVSGKFEYQKKAPDGTWSTSITKHSLKNLFSGDKGTDWVSVQKTTAPAYVGPVITPADGADAVPYTSWKNIDAWAPYMKKGEYPKTGTTVIAYNSNGNKRLIYDADNKEFKRQVWDPVLSSWETKDSHKTALASLAKEGKTGYTYKYYKTNWYPVTPKTHVPGVSGPGAPKLPVKSPGGYVTPPGTPPVGDTAVMGVSDTSKYTHNEKKDIYKEIINRGMYTWKPETQTFDIIKGVALDKNMSMLDVLRILDEMSEKNGTTHNQYYEKKLIAWLKTPKGHAHAHKLQKILPATPEFKPEAKIDLSKLPSKEESDGTTYPVISSAKSYALWQDMVDATAEWTGAEKAGVRAYTGNVSDSINGYFYGKHDSISPTLFNHAKNAQKGMRPLTEPIMLHRGTNWDQLKMSGITEAQAAVGQVRVSEGFNSASWGGDAAMSGNVVLEIELPAGTPVALADAVTKNSGEREWLIAAGVHYQILDVQSVSSYQTKVRVRVVRDPDVTTDAQSLMAGNVLGTNAPQMQKQLNESEIEARGKLVDKLLAQHANLDTLKQFGGGGYGAGWDTERDKIHRQIIDELYAAASGVPNDGKAIFLGGPIGAGKTTTLRDHSGVNTDDYLMISPDDIKDILAARGLIPEIPGHPEISPLERSTLVQAETLRIALMLGQRAAADKKNVIWDTTMGSSNTTRRRLQDLRDQGYSDISAVVVTAPAKTTAARSKARYLAGLNDWIAGKGNGGRYVPQHVLDDQYSSGNKAWALTTLDEMGHLFTDVKIFNNAKDNAPPKLVTK